MQLVHDGHDGGVGDHLGGISRPDGKHIRGSIWVEQEIAIAGFLEQMRERRAFPVAVYTQRGIREEGRFHLAPRVVGVDLRQEITFVASG